VKNLKKLLEELPPIIGRKSIDKLLPGVIDPRHLANLDSKGLGPKRCKFGKHVFYRRDDFIEWFVERVENKKPE